MPLPARITRSVPLRRRKPREGMSAKHLANVRSLGCCICGSAADPHHLMGLGLGRGMGRKNADRWCLPLCRPHHNEAHAAGNTEAWLTKQGIDGRALASALWAQRDNIEAMLRVVFNHRQVAAQQKRQGEAA